MAGVMNGAQFYKKMIGHKGRIDFSSTLQDPKQWPALGESRQASTAVQPSTSTNTNSSVKAATTKASTCQKGAKAKWIPLEIPQPNTKMSIQEKLRRRRQEYYRQEQSQQQNGQQMAGYDGQSQFNEEDEYEYDRYRRRNGLRRAGQRSQMRPFGRKYPILIRREAESEVTGVAGDQLSEGADDGSISEGYDNYYDYYGPSNSADWAYINAEPYSSDSGYADYSESGYGTDYISYVASQDPLTDNTELKELIKYQVEYYFSPDNLQKDFFLRSHMADDGSVLLSLVASFQRLRALTQDLHFIAEALQNSEKVEVVGNGFLLRSREEPQKWPLPDGNLMATTEVYYEYEDDEEVDGGIGYGLDDEELLMMETCEEYFDGSELSVGSRDGSPKSPEEHEHIAQVMVV